MRLEARQCGSLGWYLQSCLGYKGEFNQDPFISKLYFSLSAQSHTPQNILSYPLP